MSDQQSELERRLTEIRDEVREVKATVNRLLIGNGDEGALGRLTKIEQRQGFLRYCYVWVVGALAALFWMVLPRYFRNE